jgi:hypothetical protein
MRRAVVQAAYVIARCDSFRFNALLDPQIVSVLNRLALQRKDEPPDEKEEILHRSQKRHRPSAPQ